MQQALKHDPQAFAERPVARVPMRWLTVELAVYVVVGFAALGVRLAKLGLWPLGEMELNTAWAAWRTIEGSLWRPTLYVPLVYDANLLLFGLTRATDAAARLLPAMVGAGLVLVPYALRDLLGRKGAFAAALLVAFAPTWLFFSRTAHGAMLSVGCVALMIWSARRFLASGKARDARWGWIALGLGLTSGPNFYTVLILGLVVGSAAAIAAYRGGRWEEWVADWRVAVSRENVLWAVGVFLFVASGFLVNPSGIGASFESLGYWLAELAPSSSGLPWYAAFQQLVTYEFLTLALAIVGGAVGLVRKCRLDAALVLWFLLTMLLSVPLGHRNPLWRVDSLLPLVILAARGVEWIWQQWVVETDSADNDGGFPNWLVWDGSAVAIGVLALVFAYLNVAQYAHTGQEQLFTYALIVVAALVLGLAFYWFWVSRESALRVASVLLISVAVVMTVRTSTALAFQTGSNPRERLVYQPTSRQMKDFEQEVDQASKRMAGGPILLDVTYDEDLDPWLGWYLRNYPGAQGVSIPTSEIDSTALVTRPLGEDARPSGYAAQTFALTEDLPQQSLTRIERLRWFFLRESAGQISTTEIKFWIKLPTAE